MALPSILAIVGPTASGKTAVAIRVAELLDTEIISADSMQFYRHMAIGTGAPSVDELARVRHHFIGFLDPYDEFSAGAFELAARPVVAELNARGRVAVVAGGSGLFVRALLGGLFQGPGKDDFIRARLNEEAHLAGTPAMYARLLKADPEYAAIVNPNDLRRIVRGLEVYEIAGCPLSQLHREHRATASRVPALQAGMDWPRPQLYARVNERVDQMLTQGLLDEVRYLMDHGYAGAITQLRSLGYEEMAAHLRGELPLDEAIDLMKRNTRRYAKRQLSWFRADKRIHWVPAADKAIEAIAEDIIRLLESWHGSEDHG